MHYYRARRLLCPDLGHAGHGWRRPVGCCLVLALLVLAGSDVRAQVPKATGRSAPHDLMPVPASLEFQLGRLALDSTFTVAVTGFTDGRVQRALDRTLQKLEDRTGLTLSHARAPDLTAATLVVEAGGPGMAVQGVEEDESYSLHVTARHAVLRAPTVVGVLRGLETFLQLVKRDRDGSFLPLARVEDRPQFPWRGLLIDVARHWEPVQVIKRNLDAMAAVKLNVLHWHLSDDQGFRIESHLYPKLHQMGADGLYYTQEEVREIVAYARDRGIRVVAEFDMPGHSTAWFVGYPEFASAPGPYAIERKFGIFDPAFDPTREQVYSFIDRFVGEIAALFPDDYWHIGGDEVNGKQWDANPAIQTFKKRHGLEDNAALQAYFNQRLLRILQKHHKRMVGWEEIMNRDLPKGVVVQTYRGYGSLGAGAKQGFRGILSAGYYLDEMQTAAAHYAVYPLPAGDNLDPTEAARILGGEACMWGELVSPENIDSRIWPRTAAIAERLWSPRDVTDVDDMYRRLGTVRVQLEEVGTTHLSGPETMLRRLAGTDAIGPLRALTRLVEPISIGQRQRTRLATQLTPLTALGDIATPDALGRREVEQMVDGLLRDRTQWQLSRDRLATEFRGWRELRPALAEMSDRAPMVQDADKVVTILAELAATGEEILGFLSNGVTPPREWTEAKLTLLDRATKPEGLLRISVVPALRSLIAAVGETGNSDRETEGKVIVE